MDVYERLRQQGVELPEVIAPIGMFKNVVQTGKLLFVSGQGSISGDCVIKGSLAKDDDIAQAQLGARYAAINMLAVLHAYLGDLNRIKQVVKLLGFVASEPDFDRQHLVINGASQLLAETFGEAGRHARSAIGVASLPGGISVEVEGIFELE